jgi:hypothetical protein
MRYQVPQFIEVEDKVFGPLTIKQFLYTAGAAASGFIIWSIFPIIIAIPIGVVVVGFFLALAFYKYNDRPFVVTVENSIKFFLGNRLYVWKKKPKTIENKESGENKTENVDPLGLTVPKLSDSKLKELSWSLDIDEKLNN